MSSRMKPFGADIWPQNSVAFSWVLASRSLGPSALSVDSKHGVNDIGAHRKLNASFEGPLRCFVVVFDVSGQSLLRTGAQLMLFSISTLLLPGITEIGKEHLLKQRLMGIRMNLVLSESLTTG